MGEIMKKFIIVDRTDPCCTSAIDVEGEDVMLKAIQEKELENIEVWEVSKKIQLIKRPSIVLAEDI